jgi:glyoxylase-like metal-dependent hydrolase (beta-lactamase superfamily II)
MTEIIELQDDIIFIRRDWMNSNSVLIKGRENVLVDSGYVSSMSQTLSQLQECGVNPEKIGLVVNTHFHSDHVGANLAIQELSGATIAGNELEANLVNAGDRWINWLDFFGQEAPGYHVGRVLTGGQTVMLGPYEFRVIDTPGHSPGGISLYCRELRLLISGDALWYRDFGPVNCVVHGEGALARTRESLQRLAELDVQQCLPGHGAVIRDHRENVAHCLRRIETFLQDPRSAAMHIILRVLTFQIMKEGGIPQEGMDAYMEEKGWLCRFNDQYFQMDVEELLEQVLERLLRNGALEVQGGIIKARE